MSNYNKREIQPGYICMRIFKKFIFRLRPKALLCLSLRQRCREIVSAGCICRSTHVCVCLMMDWGHGGFQGCDVEARTNSCARVWGSSFMSTQHAEMSPINTRPPASLHMCAQVCNVLFSRVPAQAGISKMCNTSIKVFF